MGRDPGRGGPDSRFAHTCGGWAGARTCDGLCTRIYVSGRVRAGLGTSAFRI
jgi:hypothetical protein